ncbi:MAG: adenosine kinase [Spirochaetes bacterium]|nr:adenosine kinase [Spirochaetota bacterium]
MHSVYVIENPLMDYVMHEDYAFLERFNADPGTMRLVDHETFELVISSASSYRILPGGSGANSARALAMLIGSDARTLGKPAYSGSVGSDLPGEGFSRILNDAGIDTRMAVKYVPTGVSAIVVTPDHERTMFTCLGACRDFGVGDISGELLADSRFLYSTGYMWDTEPQMYALFAAVDEANRLGIPVCFDLADPFVVDRYYDKLREWVKGRVKILFANRLELSRMTDCGGTDAEIIRLAADLAETVVMKIGKGGCLVRYRSRLIHVPTEQVACRDTTGAGDSFAAGFVYGLLRDLDLETCARLGNRIASRIVAVEGVDYGLLDRSEILSAAL